MRSLEKRRRIQVIIILLGSLLIASVLIGYGLREGISYFKSPTELTSSPPRSDQLIRLNSKRRDIETLILSEIDLCYFIFHIFEKE